MKLSAAITSLVVVIMMAVAMLLVRPFWNDYQSIVRDCVDTKPERRTAAQMEHCKQQRKPFGFIIPGIL